jgi:hypothetical protein
VQERWSELHQLRREQDYVAARKQRDQAAEWKRIEAKEAGERELVEDGPERAPAVPDGRNTWRNHRA